MNRDQKLTKVVLDNVITTKGRARVEIDHDEVRVKLYGKPSTGVATLAEVADYILLGENRAP